MVHTPAQQLPGSPDSTVPESALPPQQRRSAPQTDALSALALALSEVPTGEPELGAWRWTVRRHLVGVRDLLATSAASPAEQTAREQLLARSHQALLARLSELGPRVLEAADVSALVEDLRRLQHDAARHEQRRHDLVYDDLLLELGGSE